MGNLAPASLENVILSFQQPGLSQALVWVAAVYQMPGSVLCGSRLLEVTLWLLLRIAATLKYRVPQASPYPIMLSLCVLGALRCIKPSLFILGKKILAHVSPSHPAV